MQGKGVVRFFLILMTLVVTLMAVFSYRDPDQ